MTAAQCEHIDEMERDMKDEGGSDLEIVKACALAMGLIAGSRQVFSADRSHRLLGEQETWIIPRGFTGGLQDIGSIDAWHYNPLKHDAQAMALLKKFRLHPIFNDESAVWEVFYTKPSGNCYYGQSADLNAAICQCVANLAREK